MRATAVARPPTRGGAPRGRAPLAPRRATRVAAVSRPSPAAPAVAIDNDADADATVVRVTGPSRPGLLTALTAAFRDLGLDVRKVSVTGENGQTRPLWTRPDACRREAGLRATHWKRSGGGETAGGRSAGVPFFAWPIRWGRPRKPCPFLISDPDPPPQADVNSIDGQVDNKFYVTLVRACVCV